MTDIVKLVNAFKRQQALPQKFASSYYLRSEIDIKPEAAGN